MRIKRLIIFSISVLFLLSMAIYEVNGQASVISGSLSNSKTNYSAGLGNNRLIVVSIASEANNAVGTVTSITWGGQSLTFAIGRNNGGSGSNDLRGEIWYLKETNINSASSPCNNFVVTWSAGPVAESFNVMTLKDVDQTSTVSATGSGAPAGNATTVALSAAMATAIDDLSFYATATRGNDTHTPSTGYTELSDQTVSTTTALATASKSISVGGTETPTATWSSSQQILIVGAVFNGVTATGPITYYSRNTTLGGNWDDNNSWTLNSDGSGGPLAAGVWPHRQDNVVIRAGHTITVNAKDDNESCGTNADALGRSNVGPGFVGSNVDAFYQTGDITVSGTLTVTVEMMAEGYTHVLSTGTFGLSSFFINLGYLEADASSTLSSGDDFILSGNSVTTINTVSISADDFIIDHTDATLCGTGSTSLTNGGFSVVTFTNSGTVNQICTTFTITCSGAMGGGCGASSTVFPIAGTASVSGYMGPGGVGNTNGTSALVVWLDATKGVTTTGTAVTAWNDQSGYLNNATPAAVANRPTRTTSGLNGLPVITFDGTDDVLTIADNASVDLTKWSFFLVTKVNLHKNYNAFFTKGNDASENFEFTSNFPATGDIHIPVLYTTTARSTDSESTGGSMSNSTFGVFQYDYDQVNLKLFKNMSQIFTRAENRIPQVNSLAMLIGNEASATTRNLNGAIAENIAYNSKVNLAQQVIINNYLAAKYGLTLSGSDVYLMDDVGNGNFDYDVAGVGQASDGSKHTDAKGSGQVRAVLQSTSSLANGEFFMWGHDNLNFYGVTTDVDNTIIKQRIQRVWRVSEVGDVGSVAISMDLTGVLGSALAANLRLLIDRDGDGFADNDVTPISGGIVTGNVVTFTGVNLQNGDRFTLGNTDIALPLPIQLLSFQASVKDRSVLLTWSTASEHNNDYFVVEKSHDAKSWTSVAKIQGAGTTLSKRDYSTVDEKPFEGVSYYRLHQVDFDKKESLSKLVSVSIDKKNQTLVYPNPSSRTFTIASKSEILPEGVRFVNTLGHRLSFSFESRPGEFTIDPGDISPGVYFIQILTTSGLESVRVIRK